MLVDKVKERKVQNWMKSVLAINKTTEVLRPAVEEKFEKFISGLPNVEKEHLEIFYQCLKKNESKRRWECTHHLCKTLMEQLLDYFENGSQKRRWQFNITKPVGPVDELNKSTQTHSQELDGKWNLMKLFMYGETDKIPRSSLNELDLSQTIKLMKSCTLFDNTDDTVRTFDKALKSRNQLMHSTDNEINNAETSRIFEELTNLVDLFADKTSNQQKEVVEDLHKLRDTNLFEKEETREYKYLTSKVLRIKEQALKLDISLNQNLTEESKTQSQDLMRMLNETTAEIAVLDYEKKLDKDSKQTEKLRKRIRETKQQQEKLREEKNRQKNELKELETNVAKERGIIDDIGRRIHQKKQQHEKMKEMGKRLQAHMQELQTNIATKKQHQKMREEQQQGQFQELKTVKDYLNPMSKMSLSSKEELQTNYRDTLEHKASENRDGDEKLLRMWVSQGPAGQTGRHEDISSKPSSEEKESDKLESLRKRHEELLRERREGVIQMSDVVTVFEEHERIRKECKEFDEKEEERIREMLEEQKRMRYERMEFEEEQRIREMLEKQERVRVEHREFKLQERMRHERMELEEQKRMRNERMEFELQERMRHERMKYEEEQERMRKMFEEAQERKRKMFEEEQERIREMLEKQERMRDEHMEAFARQFDSRRRRRRSSNSDDDNTSRCVLS